MPGNKIKFKDNAKLLKFNITCTFGQVIGCFIGKKFK